MIDFVEDCVQDGEIPGSWMRVSNSIAEEREDPELITATSSSISDLICRILVAERSDDGNYLYITIKNNKKKRKSKFRLV
jgi:hypothetical protein